MDTDQRRPANRSIFGVFSGLAAIVVGILGMGAVPVAAGRLVPDEQTPVVVSPTPPPIRLCSPDFQLGDVVLQYWQSSSAQPAGSEADMDAPVIPGLSLVPFAATPNADIATYTFALGPGTQIPSYRVGGMIATDLVVVMTGAEGRTLDMQGVQDVAFVTVNPEDRLPASSGGVVSISPVQFVEGMVIPIGRVSLAYGAPGYQAPFFTCGQAGGTDIRGIQAGVGSLTLSDAWPLAPDLLHADSLKGPAAPVHTLIIGAPIGQPTVGVPPPPAQGGDDGQTGGVTETPPPATAVPPMPTPCPDGSPADPVFGCNGG